MTDLTPETIAHLRELDAARTQGEWSVRSGDGWVYVAGPEVTVDSDYAPDAEFIAAAANAMPGLLDAAEESAGHRRQADYHIGRANRAEQALGAVNAEVARLRAELAEARAVTERVTALVDDWDDFEHDAIACTKYDCGDCTMVNAVYDLRAALAPAKQHEEGEPKVRVDSHGSWLPERVGGEE